MQNLYRHWDANGVLLYVGISISAVARLSAHKKTAHWFADIANVTVERFSTREAVEEAERTAIRAENPKFNSIRYAKKAPVLLRDPSKPSRHGVYADKEKRREYMRNYMRARRAKE